MLGGLTEINFPLEFSLTQISMFRGTNKNKSPPRNPPNKFFVRGTKNNNFPQIPPKFARRESGGRDYMTSEI